MPRTFVVLTIAVVVAVSSRAEAAVGDGVGVPYVYQREGQGAAMTVTVEIESAVGTREARPFGNAGYEQIVRGRVRTLPWLMAEVGGGILVAGEGDPRGSFSAELVAGPLKQADHGVALSIGAGYLLDYEGVHVPRVRLALGRSFGRFHALVSGLLEIPTGGDRDEVDVIAALAMSYAIQDAWRVGIEVVGEDLEGFWETEEAEGGAKIVVGPTIALAVSDHVGLRLNAAAIVAITGNHATGGAGTSTATGFLGRLAVGYTF